MEIRGLTAVPHPLLPNRLQNDNAEQDLPEPEQGRAGGKFKSMSHLIEKID